MRFGEERERLEEFVIANRHCIDDGQVGQLIPGLRADEEDDWLRELVRSQNPYDVLKVCFAPARLAILAAGLGIDPDHQELRDRNLLSAILEQLGFPKELTPNGITQLQEHLIPYLDDAENAPPSSSLHIAGIVDEMQTSIEEVLDTLFLFYTFNLVSEEGATVRWIEKLSENEKEIHGQTVITTSGERVKIEQPSDEIRKLCKSYRPMRKALGDYLRFLRDLCAVIEANSDLLLFCRRNFRRDAPLDRNQLSELAMFVAYRNVIIHRRQTKTDFDKKQGNALEALKSMDEDTRNEWIDDWNNVVAAREQENQFPRRAMAKRMSGFVRKFLASLCAEPRVYPKVIVMRSLRFDDYNTRKISAIDDAGETVLLTDSKFVPFVEFYYLTRTNSIGIDPILMSKDQLDSWKDLTSEDPHKA